MKKLFFIIALIVSVQSFAQIETDTHVFWQPGAKLTFDMFQGAAPTGFWADLDVPKSKQGWKKGMMEKYYFCAAMEKRNSFFIVKDSTELKYAQLIWDICELATRITRGNLDQFLTMLNAGRKKPANGGASIQYMTCLNDGRQFGKEVTHALFNKVITTHNEEEYLKFRTQIDSLLLKMKDYATTGQEIQRFISNTPEEGYMHATKFQADFKGRGTIRY